MNWGWYPDLGADVRGLVGLVLMVLLLLWAFWPEKRKPRCKDCHESWTAEHPRDD